MEREKDEKSDNVSVLPVLERLYQRNDTQNPWATVDELASELCWVNTRKVRIRLSSLLRYLSNIGKVEKRRVPTENPDHNKTGIFYEYKITSSGESYYEYKSSNPKSDSTDSKRKVTKIIGVIVKKEKQEEDEAVFTIKDVCAKLHPMGFDEKIRNNIRASIYLSLITDRIEKVGWDGSQEGVKKPERTYKLTNKGRTFYRAKTGEEIFLPDEENHEQKH